MFYYIVFIFIGWILAYYDIIPKKFDNLISKAQYMCLIFILFIMGLKIGADEVIFANLYTIGFKALLLALGSIIGSLILTNIFVSKFLNNKRRDISDSKNYSIFNIRDFNR